MADLGFPVSMLEDTPRVSRYTPTSAAAVLNILFQEYLDLSPILEVIGGPVGLGIAANPSIVAIAQSNGVIIVRVAQATVTGSFPIVSYNLLRGPTASGPWTLVDTEPISTLTILTSMFDTTGQFGTTAYYSAEAVDAAANVSPTATAVAYAAWLG